VRQAIDDGTDYGRGVDTLKDQSADYCVVYDSIGTSPGHGQTVTWDMELLEHSESLRKSMSVSAAASMAWGVASVDAKTSFSESQSMEKSHVYLLASIVVRNAPQLVKGAKLKDDAAFMLTNAGIDRFRQRCGDAYVGTITTGGAYFGVLDIQTSSEQEAQDVKASLKGSYGSFSAAGEFERAVSSSVSDKLVQVHTFQIGDQGTGADGCDSVDCITKRAETLPEHVSDANGVIIATENFAYSKLSLPSDAKTPIDVTNQMQVENDIVTEEHRQRDLLADYTYPSTHPNEFKPFNSQAVTDAIGNINGNLNTLRDAAKVCFADYTKCAMPTMLKNPGTAIPELLSTSAGFGVTWSPALPTDESAVSPYFLENFTGDGDLGQCNGGFYGAQAAREGSWMNSVLIDADSRLGGCLQQFAVYDPSGSLQGNTTISVVFSPDPGGDPGQCGSPGERAIPYVRSLPSKWTTWSNPYRIDTDNRPGGCLQTFKVEGRSDVVLDVQFDATGDPGQCGNTGTHSATVKHPLTLRIDTDDRSGGCRQSFRLRENVTCGAEGLACCAGNLCDTGSCVQGTCTPN
jgi:hypothetical protein